MTAIFRYTTTGEYVPEFIMKRLMNGKSHGECRRILAKEGISFDPRKEKLYTALLKYRG